MRKSSIGMIIIAILFILLIVVGWLIIKEINSTKEVNANNIKSNTVQNLQVNNIKNEQANTIIGNEVKNEEKQSTETLSESPKTSEEKAIAIVKKDWKQLGVNFSIQGMNDNGDYIVQVTNSDTQVLAFYTVNVDNGTFTKKEMN